jgi:uncharacterized protein (TIGR02217 family)
MARFIDVYLADCVPGYPCASTPRFSTAIVAVDSGAERARQRWEHPLHRFTLPEAVRDHDVFEAIHDHWLVMAGPARTFPFRDPLDCASVALTQPVTDDSLLPTISGTDQTLGTGDGTTTNFQLVKTYTRGPGTYTRTIYHPVVASASVTLDGNDPLSYSPAFTYAIDRDTGVVTFDTPPNAGMIVRAGFYYDVEVRFESDDAFDGIVRTYGISGFADLSLIEVRPCAD